MPAEQDVGKGVSLQTVVIGIVSSAVAIALGGLLANALGLLSADDLERFTGVQAIALGDVLFVRFGVHIKVGYLWWSGKGDLRWTPGKRRELLRFSIANGTLSATLLGAGIYFYLHPAGTLELLSVLVLGCLIVVVVDETHSLIKRGGPPRASDVIEKCKPVARFLRSAKNWERFPGVKAAVRFVVDKLPIGHVSKLAMVAVVGIVLMSATQAGALVLRKAEKDGARLGTVKDLAPRPSRAGMAGSESRPEVGPTEAPTYADLCGIEVTPGDGAPRGLARKLRTAWEELSPVDGCAPRARPLGVGGAYAIYGQCKGRFWSIGVASAYGTAVLLDPAAEVARQIAKRGELVGASPREDVGAGDFYLVQTPSGPYLLIREQKTDGRGSLDSAPEHCSEVKPAKEKYSVLSPGMAELLIRFNEGVMPAWPSRETSWLNNERMRFAFHSVGGKVVAWVSCDSATDCELNGRSRSIHMRSSLAGGKTVTAERVKAVWHG